MNTAFLTKINGYFLTTKNEYDTNSNQSIYLIKYLYQSKNCDRKIDQIKLDLLNFFEWLKVVSISKFHVLQEYQYYHIITTTCLNTVHHE